MNKKTYIKPEVLKLELDNTISLQMQSMPPVDPPPRGTKGSKPPEPFQSPFGEKPFG